MEKTADNDGDDERVVVSKTWQRLQNNWLQAGFREGACAGRDKTFQEGFDTGYAEGFSVGTKLGFIKGVLNALYNQAKEVTCDDSVLKESAVSLMKEPPAEGLCCLCKKESEASTDIDKGSAIAISEVVEMQRNYASVKCESVRVRYSKLLEQFGIDTEEYLNYKSSRTGR